MRNATNHTIVDNYVTLKVRKGTAGYNRVGYQVEVDRAGCGGVRNATNHTVVKNHATLKVHQGSPGYNGRDALSGQRWGVVRTVLDTISPSKCFRLVQNFLKSMVDILDVGEFATRVGAVRFSHVAVREFHLDEYYERAALKRAIDRMHFTGSTTNTSGALRYTRFCWGMRGV